MAKNKKYKDVETSKIDEMKLKAEVKEAEDKRRQENLKKAAPRKVEELKLDFSSWYTLRCSMIPRKHYKEIIRADFEARGLSKKETCAVYDAALAKYGIKLKK
jgi:hypothetical protein